MTAWQWVLKQVPKTRGTTFRVWLATLPLQPLPHGGAVEFRLHLKQWGADAAEPGSWCLQWTKYAAKESGSMDPYKPFQIQQISQRDWPAYLSTLDIGLRLALANELAHWMAMAPPVQAVLKEEAA